MTVSKPTLIPNWRKAWRMFSVQAMAAGMAVQGGWQALPDDLKASVPAGLVSGITMLLLATGIVGRLVCQPKVEVDAAGDSAELP